MRRGFGDPCSGNAKRHDMLEMLMIALYTLLYDREECTDVRGFARIVLEFLRGLAQAEHGAPRHDASSRTASLTRPSTPEPHQMQGAGHGRACHRRDKAVVRFCQGPLLRSRQQPSSLVRDPSAGQSLRCPAPSLAADGVVFLEPPKMAGQTADAAPPGRVYKLPLLTAPAAAMISPVSAATCSNVP